MTGIAIKVDNVSKSFKLPHEKQSSIKSIFLNVLRKRTFERQKALQSISFEVKEGEFFGIVGRNGSGKSTLLKMLAGIYSPDKGAIRVNGTLTPFIELGVGFNPELTGRDNVYLNGALLGFSRKEMESMYQEIVDFAEIERFMDQKLKNYSSGMQVRLAFSIAIRARSDLLLLDEVLAVGDALFQKKCFNYFKTLKKNKKTVVFVSHDSNALQEYCDNGILIESGKIVQSGDIKTVVNDYIDILNKVEEKQDNQKGIPDKQNSKRWGTGDAKVISAKTLQDNTEKKVYSDSEEEIKVRVIYKAFENIDEPVYGITINDATGQTIFQSNTLWSKVKTRTLKKKESTTVEWIVPNIFNTGDFTISPAVADRSGSVIYDWCEDLARFKIRKQLSSTGTANVAHDINIYEGAL